MYRAAAAKFAASRSSEKERLNGRSRHAETGESSVGGRTLRLQIVLVVIQEPDLHAPVVSTCVALLAVSVPFSARVAPPPGGFHPHHWADVPTPLTACHASAVDWNGLPEIRGRAKHGQLWALLFESLPLRAGVDNKIAWHMTGSGAFHVYAASGTMRVAPTWGPEYHISSSWHRPGQEWGTGFTFPSEGCWTIHARRRGVRGTVRFAILP